MTNEKRSHRQLTVEEYLDTIEDDKKFKDAVKLRNLLQTITGFEPKMWGNSIIGFGNYKYQYESGHKGQTALVGFSSRKDAFSIYLLPSLSEKASAYLSRLGKYRLGKGCLYIRKMDDINLDVFKDLVIFSNNSILEMFPEQH